MTPRRNSKPSRVVVDESARAAKKDINDAAPLPEFNSAEAENLTEAAVDTVEDTGDRLDELVESTAADPDSTTAEGAAVFESNTKDVALSGIGVPPDRMRSLQPQVVDKIAESFKEVGQLQSIVIRSAAGSGNAAYSLISGWHRLEAARKLGWDSIRALVVEGFDADLIRLAEIDENLIRGELSPAETAAHQAERKAIYLRMYPETKAGGDRKSKSHGGTLKAPAYIDATAAKTRRGRTTVAREVRRGEKISDVAALAGTSLDQEGELDALAKLSADQQAPLVEKAKAGEKVSAKPSKAAKAEAMPDEGDGDSNHCPRCISRPFKRLVKEVRGSENVAAVHLLNENKGDIDVLIRLGEELAAHRREYEDEGREWL